MGMLRAETCPLEAWGRLLFLWLLLMLLRRTGRRLWGSQVDYVRPIAWICVRGCRGCARASRLANQMHVRSLLTYSNRACKTI
jgi:hypothetical protein